MKPTICVITVALLLSLTAWGQDTQEPKFLFQGNNVSLSAFLGFTAEFTCIEKDFALCNGGSGAFLLNHRWFLGGYGMGLTTAHYRDDLKDIVNIERPRLRFSHGGLYFGYIHRHHKPFHCAISLKAGGGKIALVDEYFHYSPLDEMKAVDKVFVISPRLDVEMNFTSWMKAYIGIGYRYVGGIDRKYKITGQEPVMYYEQNKYSAPFASAGFHFGCFYKRAESIKK